MMNPVVHFDIPVVDPARSKQFYYSLFGWEITEVPGMKYWIAMTTPSDMNTGPTKPGAINGGMGLRADSGTQAYFTIQVDDIDAKLKEVEAAGGKVVMPKTAMGEWGASARFTDPDGNLIGLYQK